MELLLGRWLITYEAIYNVSSYIEEVSFSLSFTANELKSLNRQI